MKLYREFYHAPDQIAQECGSEVEVVYLMKSVSLTVYAIKYNTRMQLQLISKAVITNSGEAMFREYVEEGEVLPNLTFLPQ